MLKHFRAIFGACTCRVQGGDVNWSPHLRHPLTTPKKTFTLFSSAKPRETLWSLTCLLPKKFQKNLPAKKIGIYASRVCRPANYSWMSLATVTAMSSVSGPCTISIKFISAPLVKSRTPDIMMSAPRRECIMSPQSKLPWQQLNSTMIVRANYDPETEVLSLQFTNGMIYDYPGVPVSVYAGLLEADSPGRYYHQNIRGVYG